MIYTATRFTTLLLAIALLFVANPAFAELEVPPEHCLFAPSDEFVCPQVVLLIPGLATSHNRRTILKDEVGGTWAFTPSVDWYNPLIERLESEGYIRDQNLFVVHYDWRQSNAQSAAEYLIPAINNAKQITGALKVDIIAHSMGGLVARSYIQGELYQDDVDQFIMLGTPNAGAADAYTVWESGNFPGRWGIGARAWIGRIERALRRTRNTDLPRPLSTRAFFPSLRELLPIDDFVTRDGSPVTISQLTEQNLFLQQLRATGDSLFGNLNGLVTIAGTGSPTLQNVALNSTRTAQDVTLDRWRDGHANPDPPLPDVTVGDQTVLESSAFEDAATHISLPNVTHEQLPGEGQNEVVAELFRYRGSIPQGPLVPSHLATAMMGVDVLSPVMPTIHGPNGEILSATQNTFSHASFDYDPTETDGIKMLTILDPPPGEYTVALAGTGTGDYTVVSSYADADDEIFSEVTGQATPQLQKNLNFSVTENSFTPPADIVPIDLQDGLNQLPAVLSRLRLEKHLTTKAHSKLWGTAMRMKSYGERYHFFLEKDDTKNAQKFYKKLQADFATFSLELDRQIARGEIDAVGAVELDTLRDQLAATGL